MSAAFAWTPEAVAELRACLDEGLTFTAAAERLGTTKNACIGKARRLGLIRSESAPQSTMQLAIRAGIELKLADVRTTVNRLAALDIFPPRDACVFPLGHPGEAGFRFCGDAVADIGEPYCPEHRARAWVGTKTPAAEAAE